MKRRGSEVTAGFLQVNPLLLPADNSVQSVFRNFNCSVPGIQLSLLVRESLVCSFPAEDCERFIFNLSSRLYSLDGGRRKQEKARKRFPVLLHFSKHNGSTLPRPTNPPPPSKHDRKTASKSSPKALVSLAQSLSPSLV